MAASLKILVPEATKNYIENPSFRYNTDGWYAISATMTRALESHRKTDHVVQGVTISRTLTYKLYGVSAVEVVTDGLSLNEGIFYRVNDIAEGGKLNNEPVTVSAYVRGSGRVRIRLWAGPMGEWASDAISLSPLYWKRLEVSGSLQSQYGDVRLYVETDEIAQDVIFYVDGAQMERKAYATSYCDGDQPGCRWNIVDSASISSRSPYTREGGKWVTLAGPCRDWNDIYITVLGGMGIPPLSHNIQPWAQAAGSYYQNTKVLDRTVTVSFHVKREHRHIVTNVDTSPLHELRQQLVDILKTDRTGGGEAFWFSYQEGSRELFLKMRYEAGLEGDWDIRNQWINSFPVRFLVVDPYFVENNAHVQVLDVSKSMFGSKIIARVDGEWDNLDRGFNDTVYKIKRDGQGKIFAVGSFTKNYAETKNLSKVAYWDGEEWTALATAVDGIVYDIAFAPSGDVYITGSFTTVSGVAANRVAKWTKSTSTWSAMESGLNDTGYCIIVSPDGDVYVGGAFTQAGGNWVRYIAKWDGLSFSAIGIGATGPGVDSTVYSLVANSTGSIIYLGGAFVKTYGSPSNDLNYVGKYTKSTNLITALGSGFNDVVHVLGRSPAGTLYAGGEFTASGTTTLSYVAQWNNSAWIPLGGTITMPAPNVPEVTAMEVVNDNEIYIAGLFTDVEGMDSFTFLALWNGSAWVNPDVMFQTPVVNTICKVGNDIYLAGSMDYATTIYGSEENSILNYGTAEVYPVIYVIGQGRVVWIENQSTGKRIYMDLLVQLNEEVFIDFGKKTISSSIRSNLLTKLLHGSDFTDFVLIPGLNTISVFVKNDVNCQMYIFYQPRHWSADATIDAEELE